MVPHLGTCVHAITPTGQTTRAVSTRFYTTPVLGQLINFGRAGAYVRSRALTAPQAFSNEPPASSDLVSLSEDS
jgi:hypothetical protein